MIQILLIALLTLALVAAVSIFIVILQSRKAQKAAEEMQTMRDAFTEVRVKAERLRKALDVYTVIEEGADAERKNLAKTLDSDLVTRANNLFK